MTTRAFALSTLFLVTGTTALASPALADGFTVTSTDVKDGATLTNKQVFKGFGCSGENVSPQLTWKGAPAGTKSYAVTIYDPDAPTGSGWWHWVVYNLPGTTTSLPSGAGDASKNLLPAGAVQGRTDFGMAGFGGACPPPGDKPHRYIVTVFALKVPKIEVPVDATAALIGFNLHANKLATASMTARFGR